MKSIHINIIHHGEQVHAYGPNVREAIVTLDPGHSFWSLETEKMWALEYFKRNVGSYYDDENPPPDPFCFELKGTHRLSPNKWRIRAERRYDD